MAKRRNKVETLIDRILKDTVVRTGITTKSLLWFFRIYLSAYIKYETAPFQKEIMHAAEDESNDLVVISAFRGSSKSTLITTGYVLWSILGKQKRKFAIIMSKTEDKARDHLKNIKLELESNELLKRDLGPFEEERNNLGTYTLYIPKFNAKIMIGSVESSIRGARFGDKRPDLLVIDDAETIESIKTKEGREKVWNWFTGDIRPSGDKGTRTFVLGNLFAKDSLMERLRREIQSGERDGLYLEFPIANDDGNPTWPGKFANKEAIEAERRNVGDPVAWAREYMLKMVTEDSQMIDYAWIGRYDSLPKDIRYFAIGVDPAISEKETADCTAIVTVAVAGFGNDERMYVMPNPINRRMTSLVTVDAIEEVGRALRHIAPVAIYVEDVGYQRSLVHILQAKGWNVQGVRVDHHDKRSRLSPVSYLIERKDVLFPHIGCDLLIQQLVGFPFEKHDDLVDAFSMVGNKIIEKRDLERCSGILQIVQKDLKDIRDGKIPTQPTPSFTAMAFGMMRGMR